MQFVTAICAGRAKSYQSWNDHGDWLYGSGALKSNFLDTASTLKLYSWLHHSPHMDCAIEINDRD